MASKNAPMLRILRGIAKVLPWLGKALERLIDSLGRENQTAEDIIRQRLGSDASVAPSANRDNQVKSQSTLTSEARPPVEPRPEPTSDARVAGEKSAAELTDGTSLAAQEMALRQIQQDYQDRGERMRSNLARIQRQDTAVFYVMLVSGVISLVLIVWGTYSFVQNGVNVVAVLSELVGLVSGTGTAILRRLQKDLRKKSAGLERDEEHQTQYLRAIQSALVLTGPEREKQLAETAKWLREGVRKGP
jgi:hypothetical protein